jgi:hypothetical protein
MRGVQLSGCRSLHVGVAGGGLVDVGLVNDEKDLAALSAKIPHAPQLFLELCMPAAAAIVACTHVLRSAEGDACDALNVLQAELGNGLASLLLVAGVDGDGGALGDHGIAFLFGVAGLILVDLDVLLLGLVGELFNAGVGHFCCDVVIALFVSGFQVSKCNSAGKSDEKGLACGRARKVSECA